MAIDTAVKRRAVSFIIPVNVGVTPTSTKPVFWRKTAGWSYDLPPSFVHGNIQAQDVGLWLQSLDLGMYIKQ